MKAMDFLVEQKTVRFIGVSNFSVDLIKEVQSHSRNKIVANQVEYNLLRREPEDELLPYCQKNDIMLIAYQPIARGKLARPGFRILDDLAKKYDKTQAQIAINWLISHKNVITIPKASKIKHLKENLGAIGWSMDVEDIEKLNREF
ncbi:MAG: aldo/keto reductase [bacterium]